MPADHTARPMVSLGAMQGVTRGKAADGCNMCLQIMQRSPGIEELRMASSRVGAHGGIALAKGLSTGVSPCLCCSPSLQLHRDGVTVWPSRPYSLQARHCLQTCSNVCLTEPEFGRPRTESPLLAYDPLYQPADAVPHTGWQ